MVDVGKYAWRYQLGSAFLPAVPMTIGASAPGLLVETWRLTAAVSLCSYLLLPGVASLADEEGPVPEGLPLLLPAPQLGTPGCAWYVDSGMLKVSRSALIIRCHPSVDRHVLLLGCARGGAGHHGRYYLLRPRPRPLCRPSHPSRHARCLHCHARPADVYVLMLVRARVRAVAQPKLTCPLCPPPLQAVSTSLPSTRRPSSCRPTTRLAMRSRLRSVSAPSTSSSPSLPSSQSTRLAGAICCSSPSPTWPGRCSPPDCAS
jgi:hypothetical protein